MGQSRSPPSPYRCGHILEGPIPLVAVQRITTPSGDEEIRMAVVVDVAYRHAMTVAPRECGEARRRGRVLECAIAPITKQPVSFGLGGGEVGRKGTGLCQVNVEPAVAVVVEEPDPAGRGLGHVANVRDAVVEGETKARGLGIVDEARDPRDNGDAGRRVAPWRRVEIRDQLAKRRSARQASLDLLEPLERCTTFRDVRAVLGDDGPQSRRFEVAAEILGHPGRLGDARSLQVLDKGLVAIPERVQDGSARRSWAASSRSTIQECQVGQAFEGAEASRLSRNEILMNLSFASGISGPGGEPGPQVKHLGGREPVGGRCRTARSTSASSWAARAQSSLPFQTAASSGRRSRQSSSHFFASSSRPVRVARFAQPSQIRSSSGAFRAAFVKAVLITPKPKGFVDPSFSSSLSSPDGSG